MVPGSCYIGCTVVWMVLLRRAGRRGQETFHVERVEFGSFQNTQGDGQKATG